MVTPSGSDVVNSAADPQGIAASDAYEAAGITYRQLDHWARQSWVPPSIRAGEGRAGRRLYSRDDIVRLSLLRHLAVSRINASTVGPLVAALEIPLGDVRVIWGPVGAKPPETPRLVVVPAEEALTYLELPGAFVVFDPAPARDRAASLISAMERPSDVKLEPARRTA